MKQILSILTFLLAVALLSGNGFAKDAVKQDPKHYKVEFENDQVRVLRIAYGQHDKSVMHSHPESVVIFLTDGKGKFTFPDGKTQETPFEAGKVMWFPATTHQPENIGKKRFELIQVEMKAQKK